MFSRFCWWNAGTAGNAARSNCPYKGFNQRNALQALRLFLFMCDVFLRPERVNSGGDISRLFPVLPPERRGGSGECRALKLPIQSFQPVESSSGFAAETHGGGKKCGAHHAEWFSLAGLQQPCCASPHRAAPSVHPAARFQQSKPPQTGTASLTS